MQDLQDVFRVGEAKEIPKPNLTRTKFSQIKPARSLNAGLPGHLRRIFFFFLFSSPKSTIPFIPFLSCHPV